MSDPNEIPSGLRHIPIVCLRNYNLIDGRYSIDPEHDDAKFLSVGLSSWDDDHHDSVDITCKVLRYDRKHTKWSRQSEEVPTHRCIDMCTLAFKTFNALLSNADIVSAMKELEGENVENMSKAIEIPNWSKQNLRSILDYLKTDKGELITKIQNLQKEIPQLLTLLNQLP